MTGLACESCYILGRLRDIEPLASEVLLSPILVRPVREQLEHDRVIRLLQAKYKRKFDVAINPGGEQTAPVGNGPTPWYPDLVLQERGRKLEGHLDRDLQFLCENLSSFSDSSSQP